MHIRMTSKRAATASAVVLCNIINFRLLFQFQLLQLAAIPIPTVASFSLHPSSLSPPSSFNIRVNSNLFQFQFQQTAATGTRLFASSSTPPSSSASTTAAPDFNMLHFNSVGSTQDEMKNIIRDKSRHEPNTYVAITTESQTNGRGTNNRTWIGQKGNCFLTVAIPSDNIKIPLTLLPLQIGVILAEQVQSMLAGNLNGNGTGTGTGNTNTNTNTNKNTNRALVRLKWPNDVLVNECKIAGVLIESEKDHDGNYYFLVGIGVNYRHAPKVDTEGNNRGRVATCIHDLLSNEDANATAEMEEDGVAGAGAGAGAGCEYDESDNGVEEAKALGIRIAKAIKAWIEVQKNWDGAADAIVSNWERWAGDFGARLVLRDEPGNETVITLGLEKDGRLRVKGQDGKERLLCSDYLL